MSLFDFLSMMQRRPRRRVPVRIPTPALDRRTTELQLKADALLEAEWRRRVARNPTERARLAREAHAALPSTMLRPQALDMRSFPRMLTDEELSKAQGFEP